MRKRFEIVILLLAVMGSSAASLTCAETFTTLHSFNGNDGALPFGSPVLVSNTLYGAASSLGSGGSGTVFAISTDGSGFTTLHNFTSNSDPPYTNSDGANPWGLSVLDNSLYGIAYYGGSAGYGTVFRIVTDGTGSTNLHDFTYVDGANPAAALAISGNTFYGTTQIGGNSSVGPSGTVFSMHTDGTGFITLHNFANTDGGYPQAVLVLSSNTLYGTTLTGGRSGWGTVFKLNTDGTGFKTLHSFSTYNNNPAGIATNSDGLNPATSLVLSGTTLYGTTSSGGVSGNGTVFKINTDGTGFAVLYNTGSASTLLLSGNTLYWGSVYSGSIDGTRFSKLYTFTPTSGPDPSTNADGSGAVSFILDGNTLYGTAPQGGTFGRGTIWSISLPVAPPQLTISAALGNLILSWPTNATGFTLQSSTNLLSPLAWTTVSTLPVVIDGQNTVTNPISDAHAFYRLMSGT